MNRSDRIIHSPRVTFSYAVRGEQMVGKDIWLKNYAAGADFAYEIVAAYPVGSRIDAYFDPDRPARVVLRPGPNWILYLWCIVSWVIAAIGSTLLVYSWRSWRSRSDA